MFNSVPETFLFPRIESIIKVYTLAVALTNNPSLSPMPAGHVEDPFVSLSRIAAQNSVFFTGKAELLIHEKVKLFYLHCALSDGYGRIRTESRPIAWNRFNRSIGGKQPTAIGVVLLIGIVLGVVNGLIVAKLRVNSVIATLGTGSIIVGINYAYSTGAPIGSGVPDAFLNIALGSLFGIPNNIVIMAVVLICLWLLINRTELGQRIQAVGGNIEAARLSGIRVGRVKIFAFIVSAVCAATTGMLLSSLIGSGTTTAADAYLLNAFAAVFLGSATLKDGEFHIPGTLVGVLIIGIGFNGLAIFGAPTFYQYLFQGAILIAAVALSTVARRYSKL